MSRFRGNLVVLSLAIYQNPNAAIPMSQPDPKPVPDVSKLNLRKENKVEEGSGAQEFLTLLSVVAAPLLGGIVIPGKFVDEERERELREKEQRIRSEHPELKDVHEAVVNDTTCPHCKAVINPITGDGYHSPPEEPWVMICNQCNATLEPDE